MNAENYFNIKEIEELVKRYKNLTKDEKEKYSERDVNTKFIQNLLVILGWDKDNINEVREEAPAGKGFIDLSVMIFGIPKYIVELKKFGTLDGNVIRRGIKMTFEEQLLDYAWQKKIDFGILTNFEEIRLFFTHVKKPKDGLIYRLTYDDLLSKKGLDLLVCISKKGVYEGLLDNLELKKQRLPIDKEFSGDLLIIREKMLKQIDNFPEGSDSYNNHLMIQRIINRLIMLRSAEDWQVIPENSLKNALDYWENNTIDKDSSPLLNVVKINFKGFDNLYNTKIFAPHPCDNLNINNALLKEIIQIFYKYNFDEIGVNILGDIYEEYLGYIHKEFKSGTNINAEHLDKQKLGIYYTKPHIVKYIITQTISKEISKLSNEELVSKKIIDLSCGSGSFLIEAFNVFEKMYYNNTFKTAMKEKKVQKGSLNVFMLEHRMINLWEKVLPTIYGLDIDETASEIASVNLALRALTKNQRLPLILGENIQTRDALAPYEYKDWIEDFSGFDFVVGNPPYILGDDLNREVHEMLKTHYPEIYASEADYCYYFLKKGIDVLKKGGRMGFIIAKYFMKSHYGEKIRSYILEQCRIVEILDFGNIDVFDGIGSRCCIFIVQKIKNEEKIIDMQENPIKIMHLTARKIKIKKERIFEMIGQVSERLVTEPYVKMPSIEAYYMIQRSLNSDPWIITNPLKKNIFDKIMNGKKNFKDKEIKIGRGGISGSIVFSLDQDTVNKLKLELDVWKKNVKNSDISKYYLKPINNYVLFLEEINHFEDLDRFPNTKKYLLDNFEDLAFNRKEFAPIGSTPTLDRSYQKILKTIGSKSFNKKPLTTVEVKKLIKKHLKRNSSESEEDYMTRVDEKYHLILSQDCAIFESENKVIININAIEFHNYWKWWRWTSLRNLTIFGGGCPTIISPYIAPENNFTIDFDGNYNATSDVVGLLLPDDFEFSIYYVLGLLNSRVINFIYSIRGKRKDYRFEYNPIPLREMPFPDPKKISENELKNIDEFVKRRLELTILKVQIENEFKEILHNNSFTSEIEFLMIWENLHDINLKKTRIVGDIYDVESVALDLVLVGKKLTLKFFIRDNWDDLLIIETSDGSEDYLEFIYLNLNHFLIENQISSRKSWRKGHIFDDIIMKNVKFPFKKGKNVSDYFKQINKLIGELKLKMGKKYEKLSNVVGEIRTLDEKINQIFYNEFEITQAEKELIEETLEVGIPYLP